MKLVTVFALILSATSVYTINLAVTLTKDPKPCPLVLTIDITNGTHLDDGIIVHDNLTYTPNIYFEHDGMTRGCICNLKRCLKKCCAVGEAMINKTCKAYSKTFAPVVHNLTEPLYKAESGHFYYIPNRDCGVAGFYRLSPDNYEGDTFYLQSDGRLHTPLSEEMVFMVEIERFCADVFVDEEFDGELSALVCFVSENDEVEGVNSFGMIISMPFLLATFIVYALLPERNLHGKSLMSYVITLFGAYILLVFIQLYPVDLDPPTCKAAGLICLFFFMVSFFWMNVMSIDIWWTFSGLRGFSGSKQEAERKRFLLYCAYAWGMAFVIVLIVVCLTFATELAPFTWYNPGMGDGQCWFKDGYPTLLYFYGPMGFLIFVNITLFIVTAFKIFKVKRDTAMLRKDESKKHSDDNDQQRFNLYLKLMLAMGVNWIMEIVSWLVNWQFGSIPAAVWYLTDFCNALYGVVIFIIFVCKRNIWKLLQRRYYMILGKPSLARSMTRSAYSPRTTGSCVSQTITTDMKNLDNESSVLTSEVP